MVDRSVRHGYTKTMDSSLAATNRINDQLSSLRGIAVGNAPALVGKKVDGLGLDDFRDAALKVGQTITPAAGIGVAAARELGEAVPRMANRIQDKISRDGVAQAGIDAAKSFGNHLKEDLTSKAASVRDFAGKAGQTIGELADGVSGVSPAAGLAVTGLRKAGLYTPVDEAARKVDGVTR